MKYHGKLGFLLQKKHGRALIYIVSTREFKKVQLTSLQFANGYSQEGREATIQNIVNKLSRQQVQEILYVLKS